MKDKTYAVAFANHDIKGLQEKINDYLRSDEIEYVDLKYANQNEEEW